MIIISVDLGKARTGLAVSDKTGFLASPLMMIEEKSEKKRLEKVAQAVVDNKAELVVVGLPKNMDGTEGESALAARDFAGKLSEATGLEHVMWDERCTTISAHTALNFTDTKGKKRKQVVDQIAAVQILQGYLDRH